MFTQTIIPDKASITIQLPESFVGEEVRVIAVVEKKTDVMKSLSDRLKAVKDKYSVYPRVNLSDFTFDREEANDFD
ncbi:hypothetical protein [Dyadobacter psychrotolerans]|uniref:Uncharacterized protein n=1 Tax=Dyadobacter psychrotolerans TaxID=2541721 RepID=A0A4R5DDZ4_9BACT|nr:hypothetical protein [Dyadobacter psychrotolerans]TDE11999.1 hypothetical protein E0F88_23375 [Dyadobacter psychrotolerans]